MVSQVPISERASIVNLDLDQLPKERALGVQWNVGDDTFGFRRGTVKAETRRGILSYVASVYDPLGLAAPMVLPGKRILQELRYIGHGWDEELPKEILGTLSNPGRRARGRQPMTRGNGARTPSFGAQSLNLSKQRSRRSGFASLWPLLGMRETC